MFIPRTTLSQIDEVFTDIGEVIDEKADRQILSLAKMKKGFVVWKDYVHRRDRQAEQKKVRRDANRKKKGQQKKAKDKRSH